VAPLEIRHGPAPLDRAFPSPSAARFATELCGDIAVLGSLAIDSYMGVDISNVIIERNKLARPQWQFVCADLTGYYRPPSADLVLCFDVLIHQRSRAHYLVILAKILGATERIALISGYSKRDPGWNVFFHEPITESIQRLVPAARIKKLAEYRGTDLIKVELTRESGSDLKSGNE
jgi:hypothetical protein